MASLRVRKATPADVPTLVRIHYDAFGSSGPMHALMHPDGGSADARLKFGRSFFPAATTPSQEPGPAVETFTMVAELVPTEKEEEPEIVAFGRWKLVKEPLPEDKWHVGEEMTAEELGEGADVAVYNAFIGGINQMKNAWIKGDAVLREYIHAPIDTQHLSRASCQMSSRDIDLLTRRTQPDLDILACTSSHQRLGAGTALLTWGNALADRLRTPHWLEASPTGYPLYRRMGFADIDVRDLDLAARWGTVRREGEDWGGRAALGLAGEAAEGVFRTVLMRRDAKV